MRTLALVLALLSFSQYAYSQASIKDSGINVSLIGGVYSANLPGGDMAKRFGFNSTIGGSYWFKHKSNWMFGLEYNYIFGNQLREKGILDSVSSSTGYLINEKGEYQIMKTFERGHLGLLKIGKLFPVIGPNPNSGIFLKGGVGFMEHKIKYYWAGDAPPQLAGDYYKGYDRLSNGLALSQSTGFLFLDTRGYINFSAEFEVIEGFTKNRRDWNFDTMEQDTRQRLDLLFGIKVSWFFPIYKKSAEDVFYH